VEELKWHHVTVFGWLAADVSMTQAVDQRWTAVHWSTVDRLKGHAPDLIWTVQRRSGGGGDPRAIQGRGDGRQRRPRRRSSTGDRRQTAKSASRAPNSTGDRPKKRGGNKELTGGLGKEVVTPEQEIEVGHRSSGGFFVAAALRERVGAEERCGVLGSSGSPFIGRRGKGRRRPRR
jgi:hypothetical protein